MYMGAAQMARQHKQRVWLLLTAAPCGEQAQGGLLHASHNAVESGKLVMTWTV